MKIHIKKLTGCVHISLGNEPGGNQMFYGSSPLEFMHGWYDHADEKLWPEICSWEKEYADRFVREGCTFPGIFLLWHIAHLAITRPQIKVHNLLILNGRPEVEYEKNIRLDAYYISVNLDDCEGKDIDLFVSELEQSLKNFDMDAAFREITETFASVYPSAIIPIRKPVLIKRMFAGLRKSSEKKEQTMAERLVRFQENFYSRREVFLK